VHPPPLGLLLTWRLGAPRLRRGLALQGKNLPDPHLGFGTLSGFTGAGPVALVSRVGDGAEIPLPRQLQVSIGIFLSYFDSTDIIEADRAHPGLFRATFLLSLEGGQNRENRDCARLRCAVSPPF
jgi:hypothetical protein